MLRFSFILLIVCGIAISSPSGREILRTRCSQCHSSATAKGGLDLTLSEDILVQTGWLNPAAPEDSKIYDAILSDRMPKEAKKLSGKEKAAVLEWIRSLATALPLPLTNKWLDQANAAIDSDLKRLPDDRRGQARYLVGSFLVTAPARSVAFLTNSLSRSAKIVSPLPIDNSGKIFRIELDDYAWTDATWNRILDEDPYKLSKRWVRLDWFLYAASQAPLYYDILGLPVDRTGAEKSLGVSTAKNIAEGKAIRIGVMRSGVATYNRILERQEGTYGAYWRSYDFNSDSTNLFTPLLRKTKPLKNIYRFPLKSGEAGVPGFIHDGEEAIFHLKNGLFGYYVSNLNGARLDVVPGPNAQDANHYNHLVTTAVSCVRCHGYGLIARADEIRHLADAGIYGELTEKVKRLYPSSADSKLLFSEDNARYRRALKQLGITSSGLAEAFDQYREPVNQATLARELDIASGELSAMEKCSPSVGKYSGLLKSGTISRETVEQEYLEFLKARTECLPP